MRPQNVTIDPGTFSATEDPWGLCGSRSSGHPESMSALQDIVRFDDKAPPGGASPDVGGWQPPREIRVVPADPTWPAAYETLERRIRIALADDALVIDHVGPTSVPGLAAKPIIDIDLIVADPADEAAWLPVVREIHGRALRAAGPL